MTDAAPQRDLVAEWQDALGRGSLTFARCASCGLAWLPPRAECPRCLGPDWSWEEAGGRAKLISWVVYHRAYREDLTAAIPYTVALVELAEGPRMIGALHNVPQPRADQPLQLSHTEGTKAFFCPTPPSMGRKPDA